MVSESELLQLIRDKGGDALAREAALEELLRRHYDWTTRMCIFELRDEELALDCAQNIMIEIAKGIDRFNERSELRTWIYVIARRCISRVRKKELLLKRRQDSLEESDKVLEPLQSSINADSLLIQSEQQREILDAIAELPERQRHCLLLHYFEDLSVNEVALRLGCSVATCKTHLHRGRKGLKKKLLEAGVKQREVNN